MHKYKQNSVSFCYINQTYLTQSLSWERNGWWNLVTNITFAFISKLVFQVCSWNFEIGTPRGLKQLSRGNILVKIKKLLWNGQL